MLTVIVKFTKFKYLNILEFNIKQRIFLKIFCFLFIKKFEKLEKFAKL